ncbi:hypothetical protein [Chryseobacterium sp.]|uniref:hypothetical protein n=1 Tax=Chryseobacterium sp. TaxID=1871047 RepID=UPI002FC90751
MSPSQLVTRVSVYWAMLINGVLNLEFILTTPSIFLLIGMRGSIETITTVLMSFPTDWMITS